MRLKFGSLFEEVLAFWQKVRLIGNAHMRFGIGAFKLSLDILVLAIERFILHVIFGIKMGKFLRFCKVCVKAQMARSQVCTF